MASRWSRWRSPRPEPLDTYLGLRATALEAVGSGAVGRRETHPRVGGVVVDVSAQGGTITLVGLADGTTSMYTSAGGGTLGAGRHPQVAVRTDALLLTADRLLAAFAPAAATAELPTDGARFWVLTFDEPSPRSADVGDAAFWGREVHPLTPLIGATQLLITSLREVGG